MDNRSRLDIWADHRIRESSGRRTRTELHDQFAALSILVNVPVIYAFRLTEGSIKIGYTTNLARRRNAYPGCEILAFRPGTMSEEIGIHESLDDSHRFRAREYYHPTPEVLAIVNDLRDDFGLPHLAA